MKNAFFSLLFLAPAAFAALGSKCSSSAGSGTCKYTSDCNSGFTVNGACPNDPGNVKCCVSKTCVKVFPAPIISQGGVCHDRTVVNCVGGTYEAGLCPGSKDVQCCLPKPSAPKPPPPSTCPRIKTIPVDFAPDHIIYSKDVTKRLATVFKWEKRILTGCEIAAAVAEGLSLGLLTEIAVPVGIGCLISKEFIADEMKELTDKCVSSNKCLRMRNGLFPDCFAGPECC